MSVIAEYHYICKIIEKVLSKGQHGAGCIIAVLQAFIKRHSRNMTDITKTEIEILGTFLLELLTLMHSNIELKLNEVFEQSDLYTFIKLARSMLQRYHEFETALSQSLQLSLYVCLITIYYDYCRYNECELLFNEAFSIAQSTQHWSHLFKLLLMRCNCISITILDIPNDQDSEKSSIKYNRQITDMFHCIRNKVPWKTLIGNDNTSTNKSQRDDTTKNAQNETAMPLTYNIFLAFFQADLSMKFGEFSKAAQCLLPAMNKLKDSIRTSENNSDQSKIGSKRAIHELTNVHTEGNAAKRRKLTDNKHVINESLRSKNMNDSEKFDIGNPDIVFLINYCCILNLLWIITNGSIRNPKQTEMFQGVNELLRSNTKDIGYDKLSSYECGIIDLLEKRANDFGSEINSLDHYYNEINDRTFEGSLIPLLHRINKMKKAKQKEQKEDDEPLPKQDSSHKGDRKKTMKLTDIFEWLEIPNLSKVIEQLYYSLKYLHLGQMNNARKHIFKVQKHLNLNENCKAKKSLNFGLLSVRFIVWSISSHLSLIDHEKMNENMVDIGKMMQYNNEITKVLRDGYCQKPLFANYQEYESSEMSLHNGDKLILFKGKLDFANLDIPENSKNKPWMENMLEFLKSQHIANLHDFKTFLSLIAIQLHDISSHFALIKQNKKGTRNQIKRAFRMTNKKADNATRFSLRLMLEIIKQGTFLKNDQGENKNAEDLEPIYGYIKQYFQSGNNNGNAMMTTSALFIYIVMDYQSIAKMNSKKKGKIVGDGILEKEPLKKRITFLKFMLRQFMKERANQCFIHIITIALVILYKAMKKCKVYKSDSEKLQCFLKVFLVNEWSFICKEYPNCYPMKRALIRAIQSFGHDIGIDCETEMVNYDESKDYNGTNDENLGKSIVNWFDYLHVTK